VYFGEGEGVYAGEEVVVVVYGEGVRFGNLGLDCWLFEPLLVR